MLLLLWSIFVKHGDHDIGSTASLSDLEEGMFVAKALFTNAAEVEIFANAALVTDAHDWVDVAAITCDSEVLYVILGIFIELLIFCLLNKTTKVLALQQIVEDFA